MPDNPKPNDARRAKVAEVLDDFLNQLVAIVVAELPIVTTEPTSEHCNEAVRGRQKPTE